MSAPRVLFDNYITETNVTADTHVGDRDIYGAVNTLTYEYWEFDADTGTVDIEYTGTVDSLGLVIENMLNCTVSVYYSADDITYNLADARQFLRNGAYLISFAPVSGNYFRIVFEKAVASSGIVRNLMLGEYTEFERCLMRTHAPISYNRQTEYIGNQSGTGQFLGRSSRRKGYANGFQFDMIGSSWARNQFQQFVENAQDKAYYIAWNPASYPDECALGWTDEDIGVSYTGDAALMQAKWNMKALATGASTIELANYILTEDGGLILTEDDNFLLAEAS